VTRLPPESQGEFPRRRPRRTRSLGDIDQSGDARSFEFDLSGDEHPTSSDAVVRMAEAEDTLRAIAAGEVDAFVVSDGGTRRRVFTLSTADRPYRKFVENMRDGAATLSSSGLTITSRSCRAITMRHPNHCGGTSNRLAGW